MLPGASRGEGAGESATVPGAVARLATAGGPAEFVVENPGATISAAWRMEEIEHDELPPGEYWLTNRVIVEGPRPPALRALAGVAAGPALEAVEAVPGFWIVTVDTVQEALDAAEVLAREPGVMAARIDMRQPITLRSPTDPSFGLQWHLNNTEIPLHDLNVEPAWNLGFTGSGVCIGVVEGGWQFDHPDLYANWSEAATQPGGWYTPHATSVAGVAAAAAFNGQGGVGVAYEAQIASQLFGTEVQTAAAFAFRNDLNHVKTNSWGPSDDGRVTYMPPMERAAIEEAIATGRGGLGTIFVWAAGNGGLANDRVDYDPYASSRYTLAIGSIGDQDVRATYNERGASMLAVTHSSGNVRSIYTTTSGSTYTSYFGGTSAAAPAAAGVVALMLQANPSLTWRDVQHVIVNSTRICDPTHPEWVLNAAGRAVNYHYGFGALDALAAVQVAEDWVPVRPERVIDTGVIPVNAVLPDGDPVGLTRSVALAGGVNVESVELILNATTTQVGNLHITLTSPGGTESILAVERADTRDDYVNYVFTTLRNWGEPSGGDWTVRLSDRIASVECTWVDFRLKIHGENSRGDINCDGAVDFLDIDAFLRALGGPAAFSVRYPECDWMAADLNGDGQVDFFDIDAFLIVLGL